MATVKLESILRVTRGFNNHEHPVFSPDGEHIAFYGGEFGFLQIYVSDLHGRNARPLTCARGNHTQPAWDPKGEWIYYRQQPAPEAPWSIVRVRVDDPERKERLLSDRRVSFKHPSPSPDGRWLAWFSDQGTPGNFHLFKGRIGARGISSIERLTDNRNRNDCHPTWSPDGKLLAFHAYMGRVEATESHIFVCGSDGHEPRRLSDEPALHKHPFFVGRNLIVHHTEMKERRFLALRRLEDGALVSHLTSGKENDKHPSPYVPRRGPIRICFASKKRGKTHDREVDASYDIFWGVLKGSR